MCDTILQNIEKIIAHVSEESQTQFRIILTLLRNIIILCELPQSNEQETDMVITEDKVDILEKYIYEFLLQCSNKWTKSVTAHYFHYLIHVPAMIKRLLKDELSLSMLSNQGWCLLTNCTLCVTGRVSSCRFFLSLFFLHSYYLHHNKALLIPKQIRPILPQRKNQHLQKIIFIPTHKKTKRNPNENKIMQQMVKKKPKNTVKYCHTRLQCQNFPLQSHTSSAPNFQNVHNILLVWCRMKLSIFEQYNGMGPVRNDLEF